MLYIARSMKSQTGIAIAEHEMIFGKAKLFGDVEAIEKALIAKNPRVVIAVARSVRGFDQVVWNVNKVELAQKELIVLQTTTERGI